MSTNWAGTVGLVSNLASSILGGVNANNAVDAQNEANKKAWNNAVQDTRDQLTTAYNRTSTALSEINRDKINTKMAVRAAGAKATGTANVKAAQLGIEGKRGDNTQDSIARATANAVSDAEINSQIQARNATQAYTDTAEQAIASLNSQSPTSISGVSTVEILSNAISSSAGYYNKLSTAQKSDVQSNIKSISGMVTSI